MAEAFAALGIAANIFQFLELGFKATQTIITTYRDIDIDGLAQHNAEIASTCSDFEEHCSRLKNAKAAVRDAALDRLLTRCINIATKLGTEVDSLRVSDTKRRRRRTKVKMAIISYWKSNTIDGLQADLVDIRAQICFRLQGLIHEHQQSLVKSVEVWGDASKEWNSVTEQKLDAMAQQVKDLLKSESKTESGGVSELVQTLVAFAEESRSHGITKAILGSLHFAQIKERQNEIPKAHKDTFEWIFGESSPGNFSTWLEESNSIFWITGKPGSGKSTLMKFILGHEMTKNLASTWANPKPLVVASHFFWFGGTKLQKSQEGLLRTLLFQILSTAPRLISKVLPDRVLGQFKYLESWSLEELSDAFERLQALPEIPCRIFILVDGLDEYSGQGTELTGFLRAITTSPEIKICCASRPWQEFRNGFSAAYGRIQVHDLTSDDMRVYVQSTLTQHERFKSLQSSQDAKVELLINSICTKSEGVFFWVSLVVKSLLRGLNNEDGLEILQRRLFEYPPDLEQFFERMVDSIEDVYKDEVHRVFSMLLMVNAPLPLILFRTRWSLFMREMESKSSIDFRTFAALKPPEHRKMRLRETSKTAKDRQSILRGDELHTDDPGIMEAIKATPNGFYVDSSHPVGFKDLLLSRCRDLVQVQRVGLFGEDVHIGFLHRTVVEFLQRKEDRLSFEDRIYLDRYYLARSCLCGLSYYRTDKAVNRDLILWFLYILQETHALAGDLAQDDGYMLFDRCGEIRQIIESETQEESLLEENSAYRHDILRLLALSQARILIQKYQAKLENAHSHYIGSYSAYCSDFIMLHVLQGSGHVEVEDCPIKVLSDYIDLELLENLLHVDGFKKHIIQPPETMAPRQLSVWENFINGLTRLVDVGPENGYEACEIMIKNGAAKSLKLNDAEDVDVIQYLREHNTFTEDDLGMLERLFSPGTSPGTSAEISGKICANERPTKKKRNKHMYRKGKRRS